MLTPEFLFKHFFWCAVGFVGLCVLLFLLVALGFMDETGLNIPDWLHSFIGLLVY